MMSMRFKLNKTDVSGERTVTRPFHQANTTIMKHVCGKMIGTLNNF